MSFNYIVAILKDAGFTKAQLKPATPIHINKVFSDYLNSCEWSEEWFFSIDPSQLDVEQLKLYDSAKELYDAPHNEVLSDTEDMMITLGLQLGVAECEDKALLVKFSEFYALCVYYHTMKHLHSIDIWANGDAHVVYASRYSKALLSHYGYDDDEYLIDTSFEKDFSDVVRQLVHDPYDLWVIAHMTSKLVRDLRDELNEVLWYNPHKAQLIENYTKYVPVPSGSSQYVIACDVEVVEPTLVHHDFKLDDVELPVIEPLPVEVITPQEVVEEPQEDCLSTTTNEDKTMSVILPDFSTNGNTFTLVPVEFTSIWYEVPAVELTGQCSELTCDVLSGQFTELAYPLMSPLTCDVMNGQSSDVLEGWVGKASHLTSHISDGWFGQCCLLTERPLSTEEREAVEHKVEQFGNGKKAPSVKQYKRELRPNDEIATLARIKELVEQSQVPTITTKSGKVVPVSPHCVTPHGNAPVSSRVTSPKVTSAIGEASAIGPVDEYKSTLFNLNDYDITRNIVVDVATTTPATPKAPATPKPSTAKFANNFNSLVMAKYRELSNGIIKDSLVLNKLTSALRANNVEAYTNLVTTFGNPTAVALHRQAYDAVVSAS